jgi:hypothetical protein
MMTPFSILSASAAKVENALLMAFFSFRPERQTLL